MAYNFSLRARKLAWSHQDDKQAHGISQISRVGTDSTLNDDESTVSVSTSIRRIEASADVDEFASALRRDGCVIVENFTNARMLKQASEEAKPWLLAQDGRASSDGTPLIKQSATVRNEFFADRTYQKLCENFLAVETTKWKNNRQTTELCQPILSSASVDRLWTANAEGELFRRDSALAAKHESVNTYQQGRDSMLGLIVAGFKSVRVSTALGSHMYGNEVPGLNKDLVEEELEPGQALIVLGSAYHFIAAQDKQETADEGALAYTLWSCAGVYRPEEQTALMINTAELKQYPKVVQQRLR